MSTDLVSYLDKTYKIKMNCSNKSFQVIKMNTNGDNDYDYLKQNNHYCYFNTQHSLDLIYINKKQYPKSIFLLRRIKQQQYNSNEIAIEEYLSPWIHSDIITDDIVLEGELIENQFLISDLIVFNNRYTGLQTMDKRLDLIRNEILPKLSLHSNNDPSLLFHSFHVILKHFMTYAQMYHFINSAEINTSNEIKTYRKYITGIIFRPNEKGRKNFLFNFKGDLQIAGPQQQQQQQSKVQQQKPHISSITTSTSNSTSTSTSTSTSEYVSTEFLLMECEEQIPDNYQLYNVNDKNIFVGNALINDIDTSLRLQKYIECLPRQIRKMGVHVLCEYNKNFKKWKPVEII